MGRAGVLVLPLLLAALAGHCAAFDFYHKYAYGDKVTLWVNKVGPYNNPQETYNYYELPFCRPPGAKTAPQHKWGGLGEVLEGNELIDSQLTVKFQHNMTKQTICQMTLDANKAKKFTYAIQNRYWFELFMDDLPIWGFVGELAQGDKTDGMATGDEDVVINTHKRFDINYNGDRIIQVNLTAENPQSVVAGQSLEFTYSVKWESTDIPFSKRFDRYLDYNFFEHQERDVSEESGWKLVHGDVFRSPRYLVLLSALVGTGAQLTLLVLFVILIAIVGMLYVGRGTIATAFIICYSLTSFIAGYVSGGFYSRNDGKHWIKSMLLTASLFPFTCFAIGFALNTVAIFYHSLAAIPFGTMVVMFVIWAFISFPLALLGTVVGRNWSGIPDNPCRVKTIPRPIPQKKWYLTPTVVSLMGGLLPFGSIFIEMYFIFTSFWNYKVYYVYGFMLLVFLILIIVTVCVTIVGTYFLLNAENYHWQWTACYASAIGYLGSSLFVRRIYRNIKCD
eukprot:SM000131S26747  [mRNA]  locus=s131:285974:290027:+ [translate_table: standard]